MRGGQGDTSSLHTLGRVNRRPALNSLWFVRVPYSLFHWVGLTSPTPLSFLASHQQKDSRLSAAMASLRWAHQTSGGAGVASTSGISTIKSIPVSCCIAGEAAKLARVKNAPNATVALNNAWGSLPAGPGGMQAQQKD